MKTAKEYIEKMQSDKEFAAQMSEKAKALLAAGEKDVFAAVSKAAKELGYELSPEQVREINKRNEDISEEELGKLAGVGCPGSLHPSSRWICSRTLSNDHHPWKALSSLRAAFCMALLDFILTTAMGCEYQLDYPQFNFLGSHS